MAQKPDDASNLQGSNDTFVRALTTQTGQGGQQNPGNPVADARAKLQAQQSGDTRGFVRRLIGFAGGTSEVPGWANASDRAFAATKQDFNSGNYARAAGDAVRGVGMLPISRLATIGNVAQDVVLPKITDFATGLVGGPAAPAAVAPVAAAPAAPVAPVAAAPAQVAPRAPVASLAGPAQPSMPAPLSPQQHTMEDFLKATNGLTWRQAAQLLNFAPPDMRNPQLAAQQQLNSLSGLAIRNDLAGYAGAAGAGHNDVARQRLDQAIARAQGAVGGGVSSINPLVGARLRQGMVAE